MPVVLAALAGAVYGSTLRGGFLNWDDPTYIVNNPELRLPFTEAVGRIFGTTYFVNYNPLQRLVYLLVVKAFGAAPHALRAVNLALHVTNGVLVYHLLLRWLKPGRERPWVALAAAAVFVVHPGAVESVAWISSLKTVLAATFAFAALLLWLGADDEPRRRTWSLALFVLALLAKVSVVVLPAGLLLLDLGGRRTLRWRWYAAFLLPAAAAAAVQVFAAADGDGIRAFHGGSLATHVATIVAVLPSYAGSLLLPFGHAARRTFDPVTTAADPRLWGGVVLLAGCVWACRRSWRGERRVFVALTWFLVVLLPTLIVPIPIVHADRYIYLGLLLLPAVLLAGAARVPRPSGRWVRAAAAGWALWSAVAAISYAAVWTTSRSLWTHSLERHPGDAESWTLLGFALRDEGRVDDACASLEQALRIDPARAEAAENLAVLEIRRGGYAHAEALLRRVVAEAPERDSAWAALAAVVDLGGRPDEAAAIFEEGLRRCPDSEQILANRDAFRKRRDGS